MDEFHRKRSEVISIPYQPHIDGLRAVAVLLVIFHHMGNWMGLGGGYVGVDVFFVISGFLITSIIKSELASGRFNFGGFYRRRVIRLAPAYFAVLLFTTVAALLWMLPGELMAYADSMAWSSLFMANFYMWKEIGGYFGANADTAPLLHLWSLAVEEQFYLFWPLALLIGHRLFFGRTIMWGVVVVALFGTALSQWGTERFPGASYYLLPTRVFELATGAVLAYLPFASLGRTARSALSLIGIGLVLYAAFAYGKETLFPGYAALAPVVGTAMLIRWSDGTLIGSLLSVPLMILIGKISYPAYLWHWPIIAFLNIQGIEIDAYIGLGVVVATFVLSWLTYRYLELPARRFLAHPPRIVIFAGAVVPIIASVALTLVFQSERGFPARFSESLNRKSEALLAFPSKFRGLCNEGPPSRPLPPEDCVLGRPDGNVDFLLVGDSHANHFSGFMDELGRDSNMRGYDVTRSNAPLLVGVTLQMANEPLYNRNFTLRNTFIESHLSENRYDTIVLGGAWADFYNRRIVHGETRGLDGDGFEQGLRATLRLANRAAEHVIVLTSIPQLPEGMFDCPLRRERFAASLDCRLRAAEHRRSVAAVSAVFQRLGREFPRVYWLEVDRLFCDEEYCQTEMDGLPLYKDGGHLNDIGSRLLAHKWLERFGNPLVADGAGRSSEKP